MKMAPTSGVGAMIVHTILDGSQNHAGTLEIQRDVLDEVRVVVQRGVVRPQPSSPPDNFTDTRQDCRRQ